MNKKTEVGLKQLLAGMKTSLIAFAALAALAAAGTVLMRDRLLDNAYDTGMALSASCAAEERGSLAVYETLLSFGTASLDRQLTQGVPDVESWLELYFQRLETVLGEGTVDPYAVVEGKIIAANPWDGDTDYDYSSTPWYTQAVEAGGQIVFTNVYTDVIYSRPVVTAAQMCPESGAVMAFDILPENLELDLKGLREGDSFFLCDSQGTIVYKDTDMDYPQEEIQSYVRGIVERIDSGQLSKDASIRDMDGERRGVYSTRMENGWYSIVTVPYSRVLGTLRGFIAALALMFLVSFAALAVHTWREQRMDMWIKRAGETVRTLGNAYYALYRVDYESETYEMIKGSDYVRERIPERGPYESLLITASQVIEAEAYQDFTRSFSCENIRELVSQRVRDFGGDFLRRFGEEYRWVSVRVLYDASLMPGEVVLCFKEVEREKQKQLQEWRLLEESLQMARQNQEAKQAFFRNMSHDMRTPLNAILGSSDLLRLNLSDPAKAAEYLDNIDSSGKYLLQLINDILDMARMEHGQLQLSQNKFDLRECLDQCLRGFRVQAEKQGKQLRERVSVRDPIIRGDDFRLQQILNNLLSNAFKYTPEGGTVSLTAEQLDQGEFPKYKFVVTDTGIGMSQEFLERLFEPYAREMRFSDRQASGTGLGMFITKSLVSQMEGDIQVESQPGRGSTFTLVIPFARGEGSQEKKERAEQFTMEGLSLLLAEDNEINMEITTQLLEARGAKITQAYNGLEAVDKFLSAPAGAFDAILMDMQMPQMDGCEAAKTIRASDHPDAKKVPIIALTANAFAEDIAATAAAGMDAHVSKPIDMGTLERTLRRALDKGLS